MCASVKENQTHYPGFDVMREAAEWDDHTREIVKKRLEPVPALDFLSPGEAQTLAAIAVALVDDDRAEITEFIIKHIDNAAGSMIGEDQRQADAPPEAELIRRGLAALEIAAQGDFGSTFPGLPLLERRMLLGRVERGELPPTGLWSALPQQELFRKLLNRVVEAYYSHPTVWSEIGYAGPAYPRGYVRVELGLADPWEPKSAAETSLTQKERH